MGKKKKEEKKKKFSGNHYIPSDCCMLPQSVLSYLVGNSSCFNWGDNKIAYCRKSD